LPLPRRDKLVQILLGVALVAVCLWLQRTDAGVVRSLLQRIEYVLYDLRLQASLERVAPDPRIVIVDIDDASLKQEGRWPWPRDKVATLLERLQQAGPAVVALDILFAEPEANIAERVAAELPAGAPERLLVRALSPRFDHDRRLAEVLGRGDTVLGYVFHDDPHAPPSGALPHSHQPLPPSGGRRLVIPAFANYSANLAALQQAAGHGGFFTVTADEDGINRRVPLVLRHGDRLYPALALEVARLYLLLDGFELETAAIGDIEAVEAIRLGKIRIPTDEAGRVIVPYRGPQGSFRYVSATDVLRDRANPALLEGAIVLVGTSAPGLFDLRATPVQAAYPGVEVHANLIAGILDGRFPYRPKWADGANYALLVLLGLSLSLLLPHLKPVPLLLASGAALAALYGFNYWIWDRHGLVLSLSTPSLMALGLTGLNMGYGFLIENRRREFLKSRFGEYVPPQLVEEMSRSNEAFGFEGESREMTVLFCDIRGFTTLSEKLDAQALKALLNRFFTPMTRVIFEHRGTIDKYVGDMIMAFWGAPLHDPQHRRHAVEAALGMLAEVRRLRAQFEAEGLPGIDIGIGINTGIMNVGDMGSAYRRAYTVIGDSVNLGSRLEGLTKFYGVNLVVSAGTRAGLEEEFAFRQLDLVKVKGKQEAVAVYEPVCPLTQASAELLEEIAANDAAFALYRQRRWDEAEAAYRTLAARHPARELYGIFLRRIAQLRRTPPPAEWDGSYTRTEK